MEFKLDKWYAGYLEDFMKATDDPHLSDNLCENLPYPVDSAFAVEYIRERMINSEEKQICRAIVIDGHAIGGVDVILGNGVFYKTAELSIWIAEQYRGLGIGTEVIKLMTSYVFGHYDVIRIEARPYVEHQMAAAALKKAGYIHEGTVHHAIFKNEQAFDYEIFAILK